MAHANTDERLIQALLVQPTVLQAAKVTRVSPRTVHRRLADGAFQERLQTARRLAFGLAVNRLACVAGEALDTLLGIMRAPRTAKALKVRCAIAILEQGHKAIDLDELSQKVERLIAAMETQNATE